jgi:hypothetical protein
MKQCIHLESSHYYEAVQLLDSGRPAWQLHTPTRTYHLVGGNSVLSQRWVEAVDRAVQHVGPHAVKEGELVKQGHALKSWKRRNFILTVNIR